MSPKNPHAVALGRLGGRRKSAAKAASCRRNAKRPRARTYKPCPKYSRGYHMFNGAGGEAICYGCRKTRKELTLVDST